MHRNYEVLPCTAGMMQSLSCSCWTGLSPPHSATSCSVASWSIRELRPAAAAAGTVARCSIASLMWSWESGHLRTGERACREAGHRGASCCSQWRMMLDEPPHGTRQGNRCRTVGASGCLRPSQYIANARKLSSQIFLPGAPSASCASAASAGRWQMRWRSTWHSRGGATGRTPEPQLT